jgi:hypothetical protein
MQNPRLRKAHDLEAYRKRVKDDAFELLLTMKVVEPLLSRQLYSETEPVEMYLRRILTRHLVLNLTRLLEKISNGKTGVTASIASLALLAKAEGVLNEAAHVDILSRLNTIENRFETRGVSKADLVRFRHIEIAHTLIPHDETENELWAEIVLEYAAEIIAFAADVETQLIAAGCATPIDTSGFAEKWEIWSAEFWARKTASQPEAVCFALALALLLRFPPVRPRPRAIR